MTLYAYEFVFFLNGPRTKHGMSHSEGRHVETVVSTGSFEAINTCYFQRGYEPEDLVSHRILGKVVPL